MFITYPAKSCDQSRSITTAIQAYRDVNKSQLYAANQHLFLFRFRKKSKTNPLKLHDNKIVRLTEFFEGLENRSSTKILCNSVENMIA